jgi:16S rRNA (uracil1498-N3)-methyltransferase
MRAIIYPFSNVEKNENINVTGESLKHLLVVRIKTNEEVLVLNGSGLRALTRVNSISKHQVELLVESVEESSPYHEISLAISNPKKDAFEEILKIAVELGVQKIYPLSSQFSQYDFSPSERSNRILESALIQSNNSFFPEIMPQVKLDEFLKQAVSPIVFFNSKPNKDKIFNNLNGPKIVLIGPEGGFSLEEESKILAKSNTFSIHFSTPILRAPTAVASSIGYLLSK